MKNYNKNMVFFLKNQGGTYYSHLLQLAYMMKPSVTTKLPTLWNRKSW